MRPTDWSPLGLSSDPIPGDPDVVTRGGRDYLDIADAIRDAHRKLDSIDLGAFVSESVDELRSKAKSVAKNIEKAESRYRATGQALVDYSPKLDRAQRDSVEALNEARLAQSASDDAANDKTHYLKLANDATDPAEQLKYTNLAHDDSASTAANSKLSAAKEKLDAAIGDRNKAADTAVSDIQDITKHDGLKDSWWDNWGKQLLKVITDVAGWVSAIAGILALVVCWIPVIGQVLGAALLIIAAAAAIVNALGNIVLAATGEVSWTTALISVVGAVLSCVGLGGATRVVLSEAGRMSEAVASAKTVNKLAALQPMGKTASGASETFQPITKLQAIKLSPAQWDESLKAWDSNLPSLASSKGKPLYRTYGSGSRPDGGSWTPTDPSTMDFPSSTMGLPKTSTIENIAQGTLHDPSKVDIVRHALPYDGNPGGAAEFKYSAHGDFTAKGLVGTTTGSFSVPQISTTVGQGLGGVPAIPGGLLQAAASRSH